MEQNFISNASEMYELSEAEVEIDPGSKKEHWVKRNKFRILLTIIGILGICLAGALDTLTKTEQQLKQRTDSLQWLAKKHRDVQDERDFFVKLMKDYNYYKFVKTIYEYKDKDFFETITVAYEESVKQGISPWDTISIMWAESGFQQFIVSQITKTDENGQLIKKPCAYGLLQINFNVWKEEKNLDMKTIFDKKTNIRVGLEIYKHYLGLANGDKMLALFYYNNGTAPITPNYSYAPTILKSRFMKLAVNYEPVSETPRVIAQ